VLENHVFLAPGTEHIPEPPLKTVCSQEGHLQQQQLYICRLERVFKDDVDKNNDEGMTLLLH
jgi:hypothetical protein